ncbi:hypothetical protein Zm00014a_032008 [Zea mays]|uniref:Uncharacterized protein n=1 Tax=Zea mays TaxID=4577 RepID=A0A317Y7Z0_MAIZE|nr:hypothetical protein Zm00014a_032008 [Zea mays]
MTRDFTPFGECIFAWSRARAEAQLSALEQLCVGAAHSEVKLCELAELRSRTERLESEGAQVESDHLREEETQLQGALCEVNLRVREAESSLELRRMFSRADGTKKTAEEVKAAVEARELYLVVGKVCGHLFPLPPIKVPLVGWLQSLLGHAEHVVVVGMFHGSDLALGQMVSHFIEIDASVIAKGFTVGRNEELDTIEDQVRPHARSLAERVDVKTLLSTPGI